ncbi:hypothetical protein BK702_15285 [Bacillus thuringiensis serovar cameroun]|nr:hypothetical protein BK702_15285 [Bacillus thuringiensis serovar cameroun]
MHYKTKLVDVVIDDGSNGIFESAINEEAQDGYTLHSVVPQLGPNGETINFILIFFYIHEDEKDEKDEE